MGKYILGIESSCDDSSLALFNLKTNKLIDCLTLSSEKEQSEFGGIVPELAARKHEENFIILIQNIFKKNSITWNEIEYIAYTDLPGLQSCLLVGKTLAQTINFLMEKKIIPINHVYGHIFSYGLTGVINFPFLALVVSGKTTAIYVVNDIKNIKLIDSTLDNALGEVYDKVARKMGFKYPGGPIIDELFNNKIKVNPLLKHFLSPQKQFSYSGIMTASFRLWQKIQLDNNILNKQEYLSTSFQKYVIQNLIKKIEYWSEKTNIKNLYISGGVACNNYLKNEVQKIKMNVGVVEKKYALDNAAMIAYYASLILNEK